MDSFYGGKQGISFVIKARFESIPQMLEDLREPTYKDVWYGEYCIIDTPNKFDPDNGKVFRRTLNTAGDPYSGYAEYVGQIVGPAGGVPKIILSNIDAVETKHDSVTASDAVYYINASGAVVTAHNATDNLKVYDSTVSDSISFNSGKWYATQSQTPALRYNWYNHTATTTPEDEDGFGNTELNIGLEIPYVDFTIPSASAVPYYQPPSVQEGTPINDFYRQFSLNIPAGKPGAYIDNVTQVYWPSSDDIRTSVTYSDGNYSSSAYSRNDSYEGMIWVYDFHWPTVTGTSSSPAEYWNTIEKVYAGDCKAIDSITLVGDIKGTASEDGFITPTNASASRQLTINYTNDPNAPTQIGNGINYIQDIVRTTDDHLCILFNDPNHRSPTDAPGQGTDTDTYTANGITWRRHITGGIYNTELTYLNVWYRDYGEVVPPYEYWGVYSQVIGLDQSQTVDIASTGLTITDAQHTGNLVALMQATMSVIPTPTGSPKAQGWYEKVTVSVSPAQYYYKHSTATQTVPGTTYYEQGNEITSTTYYVFDSADERWVKLGSISGSGLANMTGFSTKFPYEQTKLADVQFVVTTPTMAAAIPTPPWK